jgi:hypothetical protein
VLIFPPLSKGDEGGFKSSLGDQKMILALFQNTKVLQIFLIQRRRTHTACITRRDISDFAPGALLFYLVPQPMKEPIGHIQKNQ